MNLSRLLLALSMLSTILLESCAKAVKNDGTLVGNAHGYWSMFGTEYVSARNAWDSTTRTFETDCDGNHKIWVKFGSAPLKDTVYHVVNYFSALGPYDASIDVAHGQGLDYLSTGYDHKSIRIRLAPEQFLGFYLYATDSITVRGQTSSGTTNDSTKLYAEFN